MTTQDAPVNNTHLSDKELDHFKARLLEMKQEAENKISTLKNEISDLEGNLNDTDSSSAHHQGDLGSDEEIRETKYTLIEKQQEKLEHITAALDRFESGNYGICIVTGKAIQKERLEAIPYTVHSVGAKKGDAVPEGEKDLKVSEAV
ncbi:TraR/DksA family transcriptional regulator [Balneola sp. MJW-20]|uniref:TraR/DksA family transcriptional regulator n=1 Tax=Gracilimonas aurantiaca TaxID=3234185 RepID=UPI0034659295